MRRQTTHAIASALLKIAGYQKRNEKADNARQRGQRHRESRQLATDCKLLKRQRDGYRHLKTKNEKNTDTTESYGTHTVATKGRRRQSYGALTLTYRQYGVSGYRRLQHTAKDAGTDTKQGRNAGEPK